ncbi:hypothetical protein JZ751_002747 [Albula glossodonta]|uniref:F-box domain-containing protein n=1 Tax=Albula glossodonta TaxID=121402 RepID=A0A8T2NAP8_9TELE|nr:hypothetical protein JZ751_002747 [Albula glossodonta]
MSVLAFHLPEEVWVQVFLLLPDEEKMSIRASCKYFRRLIDRPSLWRNRAVVLKKIRSYNSQFWATLRRRKISTVVVHKAGIREWKSIVMSLPWLTAVTIEQCLDEEVLKTLQRFNSLKKLVIRSSQCPSGLASALTPLRQLTHLCLCELQRAPRTEIISAVSQLADLNSLFYHEGDKPISKRTFQGMLARLPNLKQLSLKMGPGYGTLPEDYFSLSKTNYSKTGREGLNQNGLGLTRLELLNYMDPMLSPRALEPLMSLQSLTVGYRDRVMEPGRCNLRAWLSKLPCLTELTISRGYPLGVYVHSVPLTLQSLSLLQVFMHPGDLNALGNQTPNLQHLHLDLCSYDGQSGLQELLNLFPKLETLKLRHCYMSELEFVGLAQLEHLRQLVILDAYQGPSPALLKLIQKLQVKTNYRVQVIHTPKARDPTACLCSQY